MASAVDEKKKKANQDLGVSGDARIGRQKQQLQQMEREEGDAFDKLTENIETISNIVKEARNVHTSIRNAIMEAVVHLESMQDCRKALAKARTSLSRAEQEFSGAQSVMATVMAVPVKQIDRQVQVGNGVIVETTRHVAETKKQGLPLHAETSTSEEKRNTRESGVEQQEIAWKKVQRRKEKKNVEGNEHAQKIKTWAGKPEAVAVKLNNEGSYADVLRNLRTKVDPANFGMHITGIRRTRGNEILVEVKKGSGKIEDLRSAVAEALKNEATVRTMSRSTTLEIRDLDEATDEAEVLEAVRAAAADSERESIKVRAIRKGFGETQMAVITVPEATANKLLTAGRVKIGWVMCRVRQKIQVVRCFRCLGYGHVAAYCKGPDRSKTCWLCGKEKHIAKDCKEKPFCVLCNEDKGPNGAAHILGSSECESFQKELRKLNKK